MEALLLCCTVTEIEVRAHQLVEVECLGWEEQMICGH